VTVVKTPSIPAATAATITLGLLERH
jgi:hypothetical protein